MFFFRNGALKESTLDIYTRLILLFVLNNERNLNFLQKIPAGQNGSFIRR